MMATDYTCESVLKLSEDRDDPHGLDRRGLLI